MLIKTNTLKNLTLLDELENLFGLGDELFTRKMLSDNRPLAKNNIVSLTNSGLAEDENKYDFFMDLPGVKEEEIEIFIENKFLNINVSQEESDDKRKTSYKIKEKMYLSSEISEKSITASLKNGVLSVVIPKDKKNSGLKKIKISN